jgi:alkanesulfonate monooxygenase SsuD/methylene tetrahydromethanopterin reductase-like flavin-dependent oxidoreductase (luciferase family)
LTTALAFDQDRAGWTNSEEAAMHLGLMLECEYRVGVTQEQSLDEAFALSDAAESRGLDAVWLAERHFASPQRISAGGGGTGGVPSFASAPLVLASAIAARTDRLRIGIAVSVLPLSHPVRLAEEGATLDHISRGRLDFGVGRSGFPTAYAGYSVPYAESRERFAESLDVLLLAWTQESFSYKGQYFDLEDVCVVPKPYQQPHPPIRVAATTQETFPQMGALGRPIFVGLRGTDVDQTAANLERYRDAWRAAGHPGDGNVFIRIPLYVAPTAERAYEEPQASTLTSYRRLADSYTRTAASEGTTASEERSQRGATLAAASYDDLLRTRLAYGTPDAVARRLGDLRDRLGLSGFVLEPNVGGSIPPERVMASVRLFAAEVAPALRN